MNEIISTTDGTPARHHKSGNKKFSSRLKQKSTEK
jgi:hypothetical protein